PRQESLEMGHGPALRQPARPDTHRQIWPRQLFENTSRPCLRIRVDWQDEALGPISQPQRLRDMPVPVDRVLRLAIVLDVMRVEPPRPLACRGHPDAHWRPARPAEHRAPQETL